jgi:hypothetical protein
MCDKDVNFYAKHLSEMIEQFILSFRIDTNMRNLKECLR